jgi:hypothetical protein
MRNVWGIPTNHLGQEGSNNELAPHAMLEKAMKDAIVKLELAQNSQTTAPHGRLLAWEALDILRTALRSKP